MIHFQTFDGKETRLAYSRLLSEVNKKVTIRHHGSSHITSCSDAKALYGAPAVSFLYVSFLIDFFMPYALSRKLIHEGQHGGHAFRPSNPKRALQKTRYLPASQPKTLNKASSCHRGISPVEGQISRFAVHRIDGRVHHSNCL